MNLLFGGLLKSAKYSAAIFLMAIVLLPGASVKAATRPEVGISTSGTLLRMKDKDLSDRLSEIRRMGATWIRVDFSWPVIQPNNSSTYEWALYDRLVRVAAVHDLKILAMLAYTPAWAQEPRCAVLVITKAAGQKCNPRSPQLFGTFARAAAIRYKGTAVRGWEIWNEPNLSSYWKTVQADGKAVHADPVAYAKFANAAAIQIRHHYPDSVIITGGLAPFFEPKYPKGLRQSDFLAKLLPLLRPDVFDGVGMHPYSWPAMPSHPASYNAFYTVDKGRAKYNLREVIENAGWDKKELWGTEYGASTKGLRSMSTPLSKGRPDHVTEAMQAQIVARGIDYWYDKPNVGPLFVHSDGDQWLPSKNNLGGFGLKRSDGSKKPAYEAFTTATKRLQD